MTKGPRLVAAAAILVLLACGPHFSVTPDQISKDLATKSTTVEGVGEWSFAADESRKVKIVEADTKGSTATVVIEIVTESKSGSFSRATTKMGGRLRLHYEFLADQWNLVGIDNLTFRPM